MPEINDLIATWLEQPHIILILSRDKFSQ